MPCLKIFTNLPHNKVPSDFVRKILPVLSKTVEKPIEQFICLVSTDCHLTFGEEPAAPGVVANLESIGHLGIQENKVITKGVTDFIANELKISEDRIFISFYDVKGQDIGKGGITYDTYTSSK